MIERPPTPTAGAGPTRRDVGLLTAGRSGTEIETWLTLTAPAWLAFAGITM